MVRILHQTCSRGHRGVRVYLRGKDGDLRKAAASGGPPDPVLANTPQLFLSSAIQVCKDASILYWHHIRYSYLSSHTHVLLLFLSHKLSLLLSFVHVCSFTLRSIFLYLHSLFLSYSCLISCYFFLSFTHVRAQLLFFLSSVFLSPFPAFFFISISLVLFLSHLLFLSPSLMHHLIPSNTWDHLKSSSEMKEAEKITILLWVINRANSKCCLWKKFSMINRCMIW